MSLAAFLMLLSGVMILLGLISHFLMHQEAHGHGFLPSRAETVTALMLLSGLLLGAALSVSSKLAAKPPARSDPDPQRDQPAPRPWFASSSNDGPSDAKPRSTVEQAYQVENARPAPTFDDVMNATSRCRATTAQVIDLVRDGDRGAADAAATASRNCNDDGRALAQLPLSHLPEELCGKIVSANQALNKAAMSLFADGPQLSSRLNDISAAQSTCDMALRS
ncbi:hypothetical protein [Rhizorhabdus argentea]|uniref:hypothetical protein n=1 Tax=Rhizorhabdus argentea TaxID=1387174 RepID=UPI0030ED0F3C